MVTTITVLLQRVHDGDALARDALFSASYAELKRLARARLRDGGRNTVLDTTSLVHESYLRFLNSKQLRAEDRRAFFAYASAVMRSVIVDSARERSHQLQEGRQHPERSRHVLRRWRSRSAVQRHCYHELLGWHRRAIAGGSDQQSWRRLHEFLLDQ